MPLDCCSSYSAIVTSSSPSPLMAKPAVRTTGLLAIFHPRRILHYAAAFAAAAAGLVVDHD